MSHLIPCPRAVSPDSGGSQTAFFAAQFFSQRGHAKLQNIPWHKETEVVATSYGILADFTGPDRAAGGHLTWEAWNVAIKELPRLGLREGVREICCRLCCEKPETTYDNFVGQYGARWSKVSL